MYLGDLRGTGSACTIRLRFAPPLCHSFRRCRFSDSQDGTIVKKRTLMTLVLMAVTVVGLFVLLVREAARGPTFRAEGWASFDECIANIPSEWRRGSVEYMQAEAACGFAHSRRR
jgi:hypothetical protein